MGTYKCREIRLLAIRRSLNAQCTFGNLRTITNYDVTGVCNGNRLRNHVKQLTNALPNVRQSGRGHWHGKFASPHTSSKNAML